MGQRVAESEVEGPTCKGSEVGVSLACGRNRARIWGARRVVGIEDTEAGRLRSHRLEGLHKDFEPHPKEQGAVERFLAELYHDLILIESDLAF